MQGDGKILLWKHTYTHTLTQKTRPSKFGVEMSYPDP